MPPPTTAPYSDVPPAAPLFTEAPPPENDESQSDVVTALDARLQELQATVAALVDKSIDPDTIVHPLPAPEPEPVASTSTPTDVDPDVYESSRILQLAKRTAEALLSEAREEAAEIVRTARQRADEELDVQRRALSTDQRAWESRRKALVELFEEFDGVLGNHRTQMDRAHEMIRQALSGPISSPIALPEPPVEPAPPSGIRAEDAPAAPK
ncbi:MAG: hypothetical protein IT195_09590, partial [Microthrixaceae bacterium]|nr:hypothetical protein [Microthrixaceae bacterium]